MPIKQCIKNVIGPTTLTLSERCMFDGIFIKMLVLFTISNL